VLEGVVCKPPRGVEKVSQKDKYPLFRQNSPPIVFHEPSRTTMGKDSLSQHPISLMAKGYNLEKKLSTIPA